MLFRRMTAVFGKLQGETLELQGGLNIIQAPNETGKSTWCAFLLSMLYGVNSRERDKAGSIADKNRYAPWSGAPMSGRLDCRSQGQDIMLLRSTRRAAAPMGDFQAVYADTADPVPGLTAASCGEELLGVTREVYARSAFIRQNHLHISQSAELERRIVSLISSGEEETSYSEAADILKKQLNQRRHNRTGQIPTLENELLELRRQLSEADALSRQITQLRQQEQQLARQEAALREELRLHDLWEQHQQALQAIKAQETAGKALHAAAELRRQLEADHIPENDTIARLRGAIVNLGTAHRNLEKARGERDEAMKDLLRAEAAVNQNSFAGQSAEQAQKFAADAATPLKSSGKTLVWQILLGVAAIALGIAGLPNFGELSYIGIPVGLIAIFCPLYQRRKHKRTLETILKRHGVSTANALQALAGDYVQLLTVRDTAQSELDKRSAAADTLYNNISANEQAILLEIRRFAPLAYDLSSADALLRGCAIRRKELSDAEAAAREAVLRRDLLSQAPCPEAAPAAAPQRPRSAVMEELAPVTSSLDACRGAMQRLNGQLTAWGDTVQLQAELQAATQQLEQLRSEHASLQLALEALESANQTLQNRFAPGLGRRTAQLFHRLTNGRYQNVVLDRDLHLSAEPAGGHLYRDISLLSAGAADQLYLAARLAICETVLPAEKAVPIVLDDALATFDDTRCAAALRLLKELAKERQILLFTCHDREAAFFAGDEEVTILQLTNSAEKV